LREAIAKQGNFKTVDDTVKEKFAYEDFIKCKVDNISINGYKYLANETKEVALTVNCHQRNNPLLGISKDDSEAINTDTDKKESKLI